MTWPGSSCWSPATGAHAVYGAIQDARAATGYEGGPLGFPISSEFSVRGARNNVGSDPDRDGIAWEA